MGGAIQKVSKDSFFLYHTHVESTVEGIKKIKIVVLPIVSSIFLECWSQALNFDRDRASFTV